MKTYIHINQHNIRHNSNHEDKKPVITTKTYNSNQYSNSVNIVDDMGKIIATVKYQPDNPLSCGAKVWIETEHNYVEVP